MWQMRDERQRNRETGYNKNKKSSSERDLRTSLNPNIYKYIQIKWQTNEIFKRREQCRWLATDFSRLRNYLMRFACGKVSKPFSIHTMWLDLLTHVQVSSTSHNIIWEFIYFRSAVKFYVPKSMFMLSVASVK